VSTPNPPTSSRGPRRRPRQPVATHIRRPSNRGDSPQHEAAGRHTDVVATAPRAEVPRTPRNRTPTRTLTGSETFAELGVPTRLVDVLSSQGIDAPFPIQAATLPDTLAGADVLGRGRTGSGKTLAFALPLVIGLHDGRRKARQPRALVLVPTRELANQVQAVIEPLAIATGLTSTTIYGGVGQKPQVNALRPGVDIVVACPGRLEDLVQQGYCDLSAVEITVLDEADHMADLGFLPGVKRLLDRTPQVGQRLLFSATLDNGVDILVKRYLHDPVTHSLDPAESPVVEMVHHVFSVSAADKPAIVQELAAGVERSLLFMRTKHTAKKLAKQLTQSGIPAVELHGNLSQAVRERNLASFAAGTTKVLVATDIAARGIHVDDIALVVHVDPPTEHKAFLHRSGRTARAGAAGTVVTLALPEQTRDVQQLTKRAGIHPITTTVRPGAAEITAVAGERAAYVEPPVLAAVAPASSRSPRQASRGGRSSGERQHAPKPAGQGPAKRSGQRSSQPARTRSELAARAGQAPRTSGGPGRSRSR
jgi:superfamily II DNA/RNA helicase